MQRVEQPGLVDLLSLHRQAPARYPFLLQSVAGHPQSGRWDLLLGFPGDALILQGGQLRGPHAESGDFFTALDRWVAATEPLPVTDDLPFAGGWFFSLGYEAAQQVEPVLKLPPSPHRLPDALAVRCTAAILVDRERGVTHLLAELGDAQLQALRTDLAFAGTVVPGQGGVGAVTEDPPQDYLDGVTRIVEYLRAGDIFQVNLSRAWRAPLAPEVDAAELYARLRATNPAPFAGLMRWGDAAIISSSPERLLQINDGWAQTRPIAGTRPRGRDSDADQLQREHLIGNLKERAEHVMLIDLERNDLGRICEPGSVTVSELMTLESYAHVHHIVSNVRGRLRADVGPGAALRAVFPGGTITGCPKVRAIEVIAELEKVGRGPYTGSMGYLSRDGRLDSNILIRSLVWEPGQVSLRAGAGIVVDSQPQAELDEARAKARGLLLALGPTP